MKSKNGEKQLIIVFCALLSSIFLLHKYTGEKIETVVVNEVCCENDSIIYDTIGMYYDYIELYNDSNTEIDISGYYLSDDKDNLKKYVFPENTVLEAGAYFVLWSGIWSERTLAEDGSFYTGFSLKEGETVYLSDSQGCVIDKVKIPLTIESNKSYSKIPDEYIWQITEATPGSVNCEKIEENNKYLFEEAIEFSRESGFYEEPFYLEMTVDDGYDIYFTLDGSEPNLESLKYEEPIYIKDVSDNENVYTSISNITLLPDLYIPTFKVDKATVIRAIAVDIEGNISKEKSATYFVEYMDKYGYENIPIVSIITDPANLFDYEDGIYVTGKVWDINKKYTNMTGERWQFAAWANYFCEGKGWRRNAKLQYFDEERNLVYDQNIAIACHGNSSLLFAQKSFNLYADPEADGKQYICEGIFGKYENTMMLRSGGGDYDKTKLRDVFLQELIRERQLLTTDYQPCQVFVDGEYWGLYMLQERVSESMVVNAYQVESDNIIILKGDQVTVGTDADRILWDDMITFATEQDMSIQENYEQLLEMIDIQSCIEYYCFQVYVANSDSLRNNHARWRVRVKGNEEYTDGKWRWIIYDVDDSLGDKEGFNSANVNSFVEGNYYYSIFGDKLFAALIKNKQFQQQFVTTFMDMANDEFETEKVLTRLDELAMTLYEASVLSQRRYLQDDYTEEDYQVQIDVLRNFFSLRYYYITKYLGKTFELKGTLMPITISNSEGGVVRVNSIMLEESEFFSGKYYTDYPIKLLAEAKEGYKFKGWDIDGEIYEETSLVLELYDEYEIFPLWEKIE